MEKKTRILLVALLALTTLSIAALYYRSIVLQDIISSVEAED